MGFLLKHFVVFIYISNSSEEWSQDSTVTIVTILCAGQTGVRIPARVRDLSVLRNVQTGSGANPASYSVGTGGSSTMGKVAGE
jgi:hypothetical protein